MNADLFHPLFLQDRQFVRDFEGILQTKPEMVPIQPQFVEAKLARLNHSAYLTFINGSVAEDYSKLPEGISLKGHVLHITQDVSAPFAMVFFDDASDTTHLDIKIGHGVYAELLNVCYSTPSARANHRLACLCEKDSTVFYHYLQNIDSAAAHFSEITFTQEKGSALFNAIGLISGLRSALLINTIHSGEHTNSQSTFLTLLKNKSVAHCVSHTQHLAQNNASAVEIKSLLNGKARLHFLGKIDVAETACHIDAQLKHQTLLLSETAEVSTQPQLEINNKNVKCAHGATVGQLDKEALFYLKSRGIREPEARAMLMQAFCESLVLEAKSPFWQTEMLAALQDLGAS